MVKGGVQSTENGDTGQDINISQLAYIAYISMPFFNDVRMILVMHKLTRVLT